MSGKDQDPARDPATEAGRRNGAGGEQGGGRREARYRLSWLATSPLVAFLRNSTAKQVSKVVFEGLP